MSKTLNDIKDNCVKDTERNLFYKSNFIRTQDSNFAQFWEQAKNKPRLAILAQCKNFGE